MRRLLVASILLISAIAFAPRAATLRAAPWPSAATTAAASEYGPLNGALVIGGGGGLPGAIFDKFIELGGGVDGRFVVVPTSEGNFDNIGGEKKPHVYVESEVVSFWLNRGLKHVKMLHTHDPKIADTVEFASVLSDATAVWFNGGRHHHFVDSYAGTLTYTAFHKVLERGGVIGGSSAGATIQGEYLVRGDSIDNTIVMTKERNHQKGFEFLRRSAIDQHIDARNRWDDLIPVIKRYPNLLGIGLSEQTAIVVRGDQFEVMGKSKVAIHDNTWRKRPAGGKPYFLLSAGDIYDMRTRKVVKYAVAPPVAKNQPAAHSERPSTSAPAAAARPPSSVTSARPAVSSPSAAPSDTTMGPVSRNAAPTHERHGGVSAPIPSSLPRLLERLLMIAGDDDSSWHIEVIDVGPDGEIDLLRIQMINLITGDTMVFFMRGDFVPAAPPL